MVTFLPHRLFFMLPSNHLQLWRGKDMRAFAAALPPPERRKERCFPCSTFQMYIFKIGTALSLNCARTHFSSCPLVPASNTADNYFLNHGMAYHARFCRELFDAQFNSIEDKLGKRSKPSRHAG